MSFYNSGILEQLNTPGFNVLSTSVVRPPLNIINFSNASSGYNIVVPAVDLRSTSTVKINGIDSDTNASLLIGTNSSVIQIGNASSGTYLFGKITEINTTTIHIGLRTTLNLGNVSSQLANISVTNISRANVNIANISNANISVASINTANISAANISLANISAANISSLVCTNISAVSSRVCYALWSATTNTSQDKNIGNGSPNIIQTTLINNVSSLVQLQNPYEYDGTFKCGYDGLYLCSVIATPIDSATEMAVYLSKNLKCIGPVIYGNSAGSMCGSLTLFCNTNDILAFYNFGNTILPGNSDITKTELRSLLKTPATSAQLCSITLL